MHLPGALSVPCSEKKNPPPKKVVLSKEIQLYNYKKFKKNSYIFLNGSFFYISGKEPCTF